MIEPGWTPGPGDFAQQEDTLVSLFESLEDVQTVLDVGCGYGRMAHLLDVAGIRPTRYVGVDRSPEHLEIAKDRLTGWDTDAEFVTCPVQEFIPTETFDLVIAAELLMHIPPRQVDHVVRNLVEWSNRYVISCDWAVALSPKTEIYATNWLHDYHALYANRAVARYAGPLQRAFLVDVRQPLP
jgi:SAM-dependent methyltransferase